MSGGDGVGGIGRAGRASTADGASGTAATSRSFGDALDEAGAGDSSAVQAPTGDPVAVALQREVEAILAQERDLDAVLQRLVDGERLEADELLALQATVYAYSQRVDVATKVLDRVVASVRQILTMQL